MGGRLSARRDEGGPVAFGRRDLTLRPATARDADDIAVLIRQSKAVAMPWLAVPHTLEEDRGWVRSVLLPTQRVTLAEVAGELAGVLATTAGWIEQFYVATHHQGSGVGSALLAHALATDADDLQLWTFQRNERARRFYERAGFVAVEHTDGSGTEEREPDVRYLLRRTRQD